MPTLFYLFGYRFFFYSNEHTPIHVHISRGEGEAKYEIESLNLVYNYGFKPSELKMIESLLEENKAIIINRWHEYFDNTNLSKK